jgi:dTDP-4-dehydrorhamnose 3,5-epimerase
MNVRTTDLPGVLLLEPRVFHDARGFFLECYNQETFRSAGIATPFVQDNLSRSCRHTLRGLHWQALPHPQAKLVRAVTGEIWDAVVDLRPRSPTCGRWAAFTLSDENRHMLYVPAGCAHGFCVLSERADVLYKCSDLYHPECERVLRWNDPEIAIPWPVRTPLLSDRDRQARPLAELRADLGIAPA